MYTSRVIAVTIGIVVGFFSGNFLTPIALLVLSAMFLGGGRLADRTEIGFLQHRPYQIGAAAFCGSAWAVYLITTYPHAFLR